MGLGSMTGNFVTTNPPKYHIYNYAGQYFISLYAVFVLWYAVSVTIMVLLKSVAKGVFALIVLPSPSVHAVFFHICLK